jgi:hypothetical protein
MKRAHRSAHRAIWIIAALAIAASLFAALILRKPQKTKAQASPTSLALGSTHGVPGYYS